MKFSYKLISASVTAAILLFAGTELILAQVQEPEVRPTPRNVSSLQDGYQSGLGFNVVMNNFGFGVGGEYRRVIAPQSEAMLTFRITGLRDESEQTFTDVFFGQQIVPNKFQRAFAFPLMLGVRQRIFSDIIQEDYRFFLSASAGGVASFSFPYFDDQDGSGYRFTGNELILINDELFRIPGEPINDVFTGWSNGSWDFGAAGEIKLALDIGSGFTRLSSIEFGYYFYYFPDGIQLMNPNRPVFRDDVTRPDVVLTDSSGDIVFEEFFPAQRFFGTPQITFTFGRLW
ncbi:MAG: hypothetical protein JJU46_04425 [Balneolaceae bacterium]|nr:hypothetical protein [Balneolaceae bacterium]MCH8549324.1 hypothetical protein [Balneolaceae bacterium]